MKNVVIAGIVAVALIVSSVFISTGMVNSKKVNPSEAYSLYGYEGVLYRLNNVSGRIDVLVPSNEAALLFPVGQIQLPRADEKLTDDQKKSFSQNIKTLSQYIQVERARTLGLKVEPAQPPKEK
ncbi:MAG TPA: hypothetical protein PLL75_04150 [Candidatus Omnitrophota bacterium]|nr:hypothetical protein [Candidatus Omnitrophota bacterium]HPS36901.1 hypothetical protein [Candidatus Omnitrophota bacterium]